ncbi:MAG: glutathione peroxidase [Bacteroidales bacterium]|nr:glutathione peroxidase [Bacteroidales bacterium]
MKKTLMLIVIIAFTGITATLQAQKSFYDFTVKNIDGYNYPLSQLKGEKVMVVNTASKCGFTPQYKDLEELYEKYKDKNFVIIGFPANNFGHQEPGSNRDIKQFCTENYHVTFPMMAKISVKGDDIHPLYKWLTTKSENGMMDSKVKWNFQKYLMDEHGKLVAVVYSKEKPTSQRIKDWIEGKGWKEK